MDLELYLHFPFCMYLHASEPDTVEKIFALYCAMLNRLGMASPEKGGIKRQSGPYCLLVAQDWMLLVPRSHEFFDSISVNSLGFAGALLVRDKEQMERVKSCGPMTVLREVGLPFSGKRESIHHREHRENT